MVLLHDHLNAFLDLRQHSMNIASESASVMRTVAILR
jgi:hypothetical protein